MFNVMNRPINREEYKAADRLFCQTSDFQNSFCKITNVFSELMTEAAKKWNISLLSHLCWELHRRQRDNVKVASFLPFTLTVFLSNLTLTDQCLTTAEQMD